MPTEARAPIPHDQADFGDARPVDDGFVDPRPVDLRRVLLGYLVEAGRPVSLDELAAVLATLFGAGFIGPAGSKRASDALRHQRRVGRVRWVERGVYQYVPGSLRRTTEWRCRNWRAERSRALARRVSMSPSSSPPLSAAPEASQPELPRPQVPAPRSRAA